jgi:hypothetical protein
VDSCLRDRVVLRDQRDLRGPSCKGCVRLDATGGRATAVVLQVVRRVPYLLGMALSLVGWVLSLLALQRFPLFAVQAIGASSIGVVVVLHRLLTHEPVPRSQGVLLGVLGVGLGALAAAAEPGEPRPVSVGFDVAIWIGVGLVGALGFAAMRAKGGRASALLGTVSGLAYGGTALCARALETDRTLRGLLLNSYRSHLYT